MERQYLELFKQLIRQKTTHEPQHMSEHDRCRDLLIAEAEKRGLKTRIIASDPYPSLLAGLDVEALNPALMLSCHLDVVQAQEEQFEPRIEGSRMMGRGTSDMKFAVPVFFNVWDRLKSGQDKILLSFTFDEEIGGNKGIGYLLNEVGLRPAVCFLPDGGDNFQIEAEEKGVFHFDVKTAGKSAHGSRPWLGENAIDQMVSIYSDLRKEFPFVYGPEVWTHTLNAGKIVAGDAANKVPDACEASFDLRFIEGHTAEEIKAVVRSIVGQRGAFEPRVLGDNFYLDMDLWCSRMFQKAAERHLSHPMPIYRSEGASDARFFTPYHIPVIISKPVCAGHHSDHEWIDLESISTYTNILFDFVEQINKEERYK
ncbi:MAG: M20/M25/M40 family metallo-hydrolase [Desulfosarcina sp.]|nr:M20/M25/M40 family metallo-hydrolase [Desulfosarcina sp.]